MKLAGRRALRSRIRDLAAASAFSSVALTGSVPIPVVATFVLAWLVSLKGWRPLARRRAWSAVLLLGVAVALFGLSFLGQLNLVVAAISFAALVTAHRMLSEPSPTTESQVLLASLLLMAGGAALSGELWYGACLLAFGLFASLTMGLAVIEGPEERDDPLPLRPVVRQVAVGVVFALLGGIAFFILFPRLSWNVAARRTPPGLLGGTTGMTDRVRLGGGGSIKTSARVVLRATLTPDPGVDALDRYWVGRYFDAFDGREWRGSGVPAAPQAVVYVGEASAKSLWQRIELLPAYDSRTLVALETPVMFGNAMQQSTSGSAPVPLIKVEGEEVRFGSVYAPGTVLAVEGSGYTYHAYSRPEAEALRPPPRVDQRYLALPALDARVAKLAQQVGGDGPPEVVARRLEAWLKKNLGYTLEQAGQVEDPLADFLFERRQGHCEHFATALTVLLRARQIPARVVGGFFGGERVGARYVVRAGDAHAWSEAFIAGSGWLTLDATPESGRGATPTPLLAVLTDVYERLEELWRSRVVDYSLGDQVQFVRELVRPPSGATERSPLSAPGRAWAAALGAALLTWLAWRLLTRPRPPRPHPVSSFLAQIEERLGRAHIARQSGEGIEELTARLAAAKHPLSPALSAATRRYLEARFGSRPLRADERAALLRALVG